MKFNSCANRSSSVSVTELYDANHLPLTLTPIGNGGEAEVYACAERRGAAVKVYRQGLITDEKRFHSVLARLNALVANRRLAKMSALAWPEEPVYDSNGRFAGYVMKQIAPGYKRLSSLFGGVNYVRRAFPAWTRRDLAETALNFIRLILTLQREGVVPCDWNPDNFLVNAQHQVFCIDCDSYQVYDRSGKIHTSDVYFDTMAAPEILCSRVAKGQPRTEEQTRWSCALMVFRILMCGMHPFQFADVALDGTQAGSVVDNMKAGKCPLGRGSGCRFAPVWAPLWSWLTGKMKDMFITTFRNEPDHGWGEPRRRAPLDVQEGEVERLLFEMNRAPERTMLEPSSTKTHDYIQVTPKFQAYSTGHVAQGQPKFGGRPHSNKMGDGWRPSYGFSAKAR